MNTRPQNFDETFEQLFAQYETAFRAYARSLLPNWDAVDDVLQTASLIMWRKLDNVETPAGFLPWGKCIIRFEAQKYHRSHAHALHVFDPELVELLGQQQEEGEEPDWDRLRAVLDECLAQVNDATKQLLLAPYREHGFLTRLADASGRTSNGLYKQIRRIRGKIEECIVSKLGTI